MSSIRDSSAVTTDKIKPTDVVVLMDGMSPANDEGSGGKSTVR